LRQVLGGVALAKGFRVPPLRMDWRALPFRDTLVCCTALPPVQG